MAAIIERTAADDVTAAWFALVELERYTEDLRAHLGAARRQGTPEPGTLDAALHVARIVAAEIGDVQRLIRDAQR